MASPIFLKIILYYIILAVFTFIVNIAFKILFPILKSISKNSFSTLQKEKTIQVSIVSKRIYTFESNNGGSIQNHYLTFEDEHKKVFELLVDHYYYNFYSKGEKGLLTFKGEQFIEFIREK